MTSKFLNQSSVLYRPDFLHRPYFLLFPQAATITARAHGVDLSKYDLSFIPENAVNQLDFVIQRVSYRKTRDEAFLNFVDAVMRVPIRGGYHYLNSDTPWRDQADAFLNYVAPYDFQFFACDFEGAFNVLNTGFAYSAWQWINYVRASTGKPVLLYTSLSLYNSYIGPSQSQFGINWNTVPYWQAQWFLIPNPNGTPTMPTSRTAGWKLWQYTSKLNGTLYGLGRSTAGDGDVFNGSVDDMKLWLGLVPPPPPPSDEFILHVKDGVSRKFVLE